MSRKGGYQIIDLQGKSSGTIKGIYEKIEGNYYKDLKISGIVIGGVDKNDVYAKAVAGTNEYYIYVYDVLYVIKNDDTIALRTGKSASGIEHEDGVYALTSDLLVLKDKDGLYNLSFGTGANVGNAIIKGDGSVNLSYMDGVMINVFYDVDNGSVVIEATDGESDLPSYKLMSIRKIA